MSLPAAEVELDEILEFAKFEISCLRPIVENKTGHEMENEDINKILRVGDDIIDYLENEFPIMTLQENRKKYIDLVLAPEGSYTKFDTREDKEAVVFILWDIAATLVQDFEELRGSQKQMAYHAAEDFLKAMQMK